MTLLDCIANALRLQDAVCRRSDPVPRWHMLQGSEQERWRIMARAALDELRSQLEGVVNA